MRKIHRLTDLRISEVSLVDRGANGGARVVLVKRDDPGVGVAAPLQHKQEIERVDYVVQVAKRIVDGEKWPVTQRRFYDEIMKRAEQVREDDETIAMAFARYTADDPDGRVLLKAAVRADRDQVSA